MNFKRLAAKLSVLLLLVCTQLPSFAQEIKVSGKIIDKKSGRGNLNIQLDNIAADLDEVIVVGYGTQKKSHLTGAIESIKAKEIEDLPISNLGAALSGRILGLGVSGGTSRPGSQAQLTIRNPVSLAKDG